jgi:hypothetical protein
MSEAYWLTTEYHIRHYSAWWIGCFGPQAWPMRLPGFIPPGLQLVAASYDGHGLPAKISDRAAL